MLKVYDHNLKEIEHISNMRISGDSDTETSYGSITFKPDYNFIMRDALFGYDFVELKTDIYISAEEAGESIVYKGIITGKRITNDELKIWMSGLYKLDEKEAAIVLMLRTKGGLQHEKQQT